MFRFLFRLLDIPRLFDVGVGVSYHLVSTLATWFAPLPGGMATAAAIIAFTVAVRVALLPLSYYVMRGEGARARLAPRIADLRRRYARQPARLQQELGQLYQAEGAGLFAGCLPLLVQLPFFSVMYRLFLSRAVAGVPNTLLAHALFGVPLGSHWLSGAGPFSPHGLVFLGLLALLGVVAWRTARMARRAIAGVASASAGGPVPAGSETVDRRGSGAADTLTALMPYGTLLVAAVVPLAAGLYLLTTTTWTLLERAVLRRKLFPAH